jgi:hypothetical protein
MKLNFKSVLGNVFVLTTLGSPVFSATINWTTWTARPTTTTVDGTLLVSGTPVSISYAGEIAFTQLNGAGGNFFLPLTTFTAPAATNDPPSDMIAIDGTSTTHTVTFSTPVVDPIMEIVSLGQSGVGTQYAFSLGAGQSMSILNQGPSAAFGGCNTCLSLSGTTITGHEGDGIIQFAGTYSSLPWTGANPEFWNGLTFGVTGLPSTVIPEPGTWSLMLIAVIGGILIARRGVRTH